MDYEPDAMVFSDAEDQIRCWNRSAESMFGIAPAGGDTDEFAVDPHVRSAVSNQENPSDSAGSDDWQKTTVLIQKRNGEKESVLRLSRHVLIEGESWRLVILKNPEIEHFAESELGRLALTDPLSELSNRRGFQSSLEANLHRRLALAIIDVDFFKRINDQLGHEAGDNAIKWLAEKMRAAFPHALCLGRLGGDEFAVVLEVETHSQTQAEFERFCAHVAAEPIDWYPDGVKISIGVAIARQAGGNHSPKSAQR